MAIRACFTLNEIVPPLSPESYNAHLLCDPWAAPHILGPVFLYILIQNWPIVFLLTGMNEIFERFITLPDGLLFFPEVDALNDGESSLNQLIDDWATQGGIGLILGGLFVYSLRSPVLLKGWRTNRRRFWFYFFVAITYFFISIMTSITINKPVGLAGVSSSKVNKTDLWVGPQLSTALEGGLILMAQYGEPFYSNAWVKEPPWKRRWFWNGFWVIHACFSTQSAWDWFYSGHAQTWLLSGILALVLMTIIIINGDWFYTIERFGSWADRWKKRPELPPPIIDE